MFALHTLTKEVRKLRTVSILFWTSLGWETTQWLFLNFGIM